MYLEECERREKYMLKNMASQGWEKKTICILQTCTPKDKHLIGFIY